MADRWEERTQRKQEDAEKRKAEREEARAIAKSFGKIVANRRHQMGVSQEELAYVVGVHRTYMGMVERGTNVASIYTVHRIAKALKISLSELFQEVEAEMSKQGS